MNREDNGASKAMLIKLKKKLLSTEKACDLLKDKRDELLRLFYELLGEYEKLYKKVDINLRGISISYLKALALSDNKTLSLSLKGIRNNVKITVGEKNVMGTVLPIINIEDGKQRKIPYSFLNTPSVLDDATYGLELIIEDLIKMSECETQCTLLSREIEKTRRRASALEYFVIPECKEKIKYITMKLDENERAANVRLMKLKDKIRK